MADFRLGFKLKLSFDVVVDGLAFPEAMRWHDGYLWFSDVLTGKVYKVDVKHKELICVAIVEPMAAGLGWLPSGQLLVVDSNARKVRIQTSVGSFLDPLKEFLDLSHEWNFPANDMLVESDGTMWIGSFGYNPEQDVPAPSKLARYKEGVLDFPLTDLVFPNGIARINSELLVVAETFADRLSIFSVRNDGSVELVRRIQLPEGATPDGLCVDIDENVWVASAYGEAILKVNPISGEFFRAIEIPERGVFDCTFGGTDLDTLFVATSSVDESRALIDLPGKVLAFKVGVHGKR